jgi:hypothetical protein
VHGETGEELHGQVGGYPVKEGRKEQDGDFQTVVHPAGQEQDKGQGGYDQHGQELGPGQQAQESRPGPLTGGRLAETCPGEKGKSGDEESRSQG